jgi:hypothetical protein
MLALINATVMNAKKVAVWFTLAAGLVLAYQAQQAVVACVTGMPPIRLLLEPGIIVMWSLFIIPLIARLTTGCWVYWFLAFVVIVVIMVYYDIRVVVNLSEGLGVPVLTIPPRRDEEEKLEIVEEQVEEIEEIGDVDGNGVFKTTDGVE